MKRYVREEGSEAVQRWTQRGTVAISILGLVEISAALSRRCREGEVSKGHLSRSLASLDRDVPDLLVVDLTEEIAFRARELVLAHAIRCADAVHLASCMDLGERIGGNPTFVSWDARLLAAARDLDLTVAGPPV